MEIPVYITPRAVKRCSMAGKDDRPPGQAGAGQGGRRPARSKWTGSAGVFKIRAAYVPSEML